VGKEIKALTHGVSSATPKKQILAIVRT
jgi:hypothetical protein